MPNEGKIYKKGIRKGGKCERKWKKEKRNRKRESKRVKCMEKEGRENKYR
jgi:hypothetical protein